MVYLFMSFFFFFFQFFSAHGFGKLKLIYVLIQYASAFLQVKINRGNFKLMLQLK